MKTENNNVKGMRETKGRPEETEYAVRFSALLEQRKKEEELRNQTVQLLHENSAHPIPGLQLLCKAGSLQYQEKLVSMTAYFDAAWYLKQYPEAAASQTTPLQHYLQTGWLLGWNPSVHFDTVFYQYSYPVTKVLKINPLVHFLETGIKDSFIPCCLNSPPPKQEDYQLLLQSELFDAEYYMSRLPSKVCSGADAAWHFLVFGWKKRFDPSPDFSISQYYMANPDILEAGLNPLLHYLRFGLSEGRQYRARNYDLLKNSIFFDEHKYRSRYKAELKDFSPLEHYLLFGWKKRNIPSDLFRDEYYLNFYTDLMTMVSEPPVCHYLRVGKQEGRKSFPVCLPGAKYYFPPDFDQEEFRKRQDKILIAVHQLDFSGVPMLAQKIASLFASRQNAAILTPFDGPLLQNCLDSGIPVIIDPSFFMTSQKSGGFPYQGFAVCLFNTLCLAGVFLRQSLRIPSLLWIHENWTPDHLPEPVRKQLRNAPFLFATSELTRSYVRKYANDVHFLPYPIVDRGDKAKSAVPKVFRFFLVAMLEERKGQDIAVRAFRNLPEKYRKKASLTLVGDPFSDDLPGELKKLAGNEKNIFFQDTVKNPDGYHALYDNMEVLLCPSRTDPMPLVVFDAMMHGCPVILSDTVGQKNFIKNGKNGFVFPAEDEKALTDCMVRIMDSAADYPKMSAAIRKTFLDNFEFSKAEKAIRNAISEVISTGLKKDR